MYISNAASIQFGFPDSITLPVQSSSSELTVIYVNYEFFKFHIHLHINLQTSCYLMMIDVQVYKGVSLRV